MKGNIFSAFSHLDFPLKMFNYYLFLVGEAFEATGLKDSGTAGTKLVGNSVRLRLFLFVTCAGGFVLVFVHGLVQIRLAVADEHLIAFGRKRG